MTALPFIVTIGNGIGPEIVGKWLAGGMRDPVILAGHVEAIKPFCPKLPPTVTLWPVTGSPGEVAYQSLVVAVDAIAKGQARGLLTGPISKVALHQAGYTQYGGHTELLADLARLHWPVQPCISEMLFVHQQFRLLLLTRHFPLSEVASHLTIDGVTQSLRTLVTFLQQQLGIARPRLALLGVNPHAGETGGDEERTVLIPASQAVMANLNCDISQPLPADGFFRGFSAANPGVDAVVAPYHDQGLVPFKLLAGWQAVNVTIGLPFIRASVSHGTAPDIVGQGIAKPDSLIAAYQWLKDHAPCP